jgi:N-acetylglutamate synthase-like GNAT family acetyltransferase
MIRNSAQQKNMATVYFIRPFQLSDQDEVEKLVLTIQRDEFGLGLSADNQPDLKDISEYFSQSGSGFWVAVANEDGSLIGCIGLEVIIGPTAVMRKFMVKGNWRGRDFGVAEALHEVFVAKARATGARTLALSTVSATKAAQSFYARSGYQLVDQAAMPIGFVPGVLDVIFMISKI